MRESPVRGGDAARVRPFEDGSEVVEGADAGRVRTGGQDAIMAA